MGTWETGEKEKLFTIYHFIFFVVIHVVNVLPIQKDFNVYFHYHCSNVCFISGFKESPWCIILRSFSCHIPFLYFTLPSSLLKWLTKTQLRTTAEAEYFGMELILIPFEIEQDMMLNSEAIWGTCLPRNES